MHGFAMNVTEETSAWLHQVVAYGHVDLKAGCIDSAICKPVQVDDVADGVVAAFGTIYERPTEKLDVESAGEVRQAIMELEEEVAAAGEWPCRPALKRP